ncbi:hypothetical protein BC937DRAFT_87567 [Endogone sp. FLAS-F59071]|nr:hypothetical protein BC937DRAFT_87567 [Endogone sp. FLAS-F59071]|eukprot:RUS19392.1 hypothetical protein BC937DRAFT_87567 [Endogone sp. FLAS-F59071]
MPETLRRPPPASWEDLLWRPLYHARALYDYDSRHSMDLCFKCGDLIEVMGKESNDWANGSTHGRFGSFPVEYVEQIDESVVEEKPRVPPRSAPSRPPRAGEDKPVLPPRPLNGPPLINHQETDERPSAPPRRNLAQRPSSTEESQEKPSLPPRRTPSQLQPASKTEEEAPPSLPPRKPIEQPPPVPGRPKLVEHVPPVPNASRPTPPTVPNASKPIPRPAAAGIGAAKSRAGFSQEQQDLDNDINDAVSRLTRCTSVVKPSNLASHLDLSEHLFSSVDTHARACPPHETNTISALAHFLTAPFSSSLHKFRAIFVWITDNILYDVPAFLDGRPVSGLPEDVLHTRRSVCAGYANLFNALAGEADLDCWLVTGYARGAGAEPGGARGVDRDVYGKPTGHAWNVVLIEGQYRLVDSTWGAGNAELAARKFVRQFKPYYFLMPPERSIFSHFPADPVQQYLDPPVSEADFMTLLWVQSQYFEYEVRVLRPIPREPVIETRDDVVDIYLEFGNLPPEGHVIGWLRKKGASSVQMDRRCVLVQKALEYTGRNVYCARVVCPDRGDYRLGFGVILRPNESCSEFLSYCITNHGPGTHPLNPMTFPCQYPVTIVCPLGGTLPRGTTQLFQFACFKRTSAKFTLMSSEIGWSSAREMRKGEEKEGVTMYEVEVKLPRQEVEWLLSVQTGNGQQWAGVAKWTIVDLHLVEKVYWKIIILLSKSTNSRTVPQCTPRRQSRGLGRSVVLSSLAHFGANIVAVARSEPALQALQEEAERAGHAHERVEIVVGDVTDEGVAERAVKVALDRWGRLDGVVANAGVLEPIGSIAATSIDDWKRLFDVNFFSIITLVQKSLPHLRESNGRIIAVSSGAASKGVPRVGSVWQVSKAALNHLVQTLAVEEPDVTTIALRPGAVDTEMQAVIRSQGTYEISFNSIPHISQACVLINLFLFSTQCRRPEHGPYTPCSLRCAPRIQEIGPPRRRGVRGCGASAAGRERVQRRVCEMGRGEIGRVSEGMKR